MISVTFLIYSKVIHNTIIITIVFIIINFITIEIVFFFYILYQAGSINSLHDKCIDVADIKYWEVTKRVGNVTNVNNTNFSDIQLLWHYTKIRTENYAILRLGPFEVRRRSWIISIAAFFLYCIFILLRVKIAL